MHGGLLYTEEHATGKMQFFPSGNSSKITNWMSYRNGIYAQIRQPRIQSDDDEFKLKIKFGL